MSLLSDIQHSPQRIYSLMRLLAAQGPMDFETLVAWMKPQARGFDLRGSDDADHRGVRQMIGAASSLGLVTSTSTNQYALAVDTPPDLAGFADLVHDRLVALPDANVDTIVLEAYAAVVVLTEIDQSTRWLEAVGKDRAKRINSVVRPGARNKDGELIDRFNDTKIAAWTRWMVFLGLGFALPKGPFYPYPTQRLEREFARGQAGGGAAALEVDDLLLFLAERMPYLDGGRLMAACVTQARLAPLERTFSRVLSGALRDLHDDRRLVLAPVGDASQMYALTREPHVIRAFKTLSVQSETAHG